MSSIKFPYLSCLVGGVCTLWLLGSCPSRAYTEAPQHCIPCKANTQCQVWLHARPPGLPQGGSISITHVLDCIGEHLSHSLVHQSINQRSLPPGWSAVHHTGHIMVLPYSRLNTASPPHLLFSPHSLPPHPHPLTPTTLPLTACVVLSRL